MVPNLKTDRLNDVAGERGADLNATRQKHPVQDWGTESPARRLQLELERSWVADTAVERWSPRRSLFFIVLTNGLLWSALILGVAQII